MTISEIPPFKVTPKKKKTELVSNGLPGGGILLHQVDLSNSSIQLVPIDSKKQKSNQNFGPCHSYLTCIALPFFLEDISGTDQNLRNLKRHHPPSSQLVLVSHQDDGGIGRGSLPDFGHPVGTAAEGVLPGHVVDQDRLRDLLNGLKILKLVEVLTKQTWFKTNLVSKELA